ncbi:DsbE family thiol:disulfide interchange protein [Mesorhizobium sp. RMAD-H1]|uniref:DsbE family thiol:disulfide interchange protein n=1 Tax=Mesorhizobium sp. RMAD-H1 TaxID=2587065 RepID=UPI00161872F7|nr:DsbE family thiol:disulfide interchange protein [Mesorhizobium sp. RMAD-H1]MBB2972032.1 cytochrome c biogenesis protein CcmG/thiol:disulfide interchange protein DsbE [Mesorhizobium sp. RMAD-H1]
MSNSEATSAPNPRRRLLLALLPLAIFLALAAIFTIQLLSGRDESVIPSALIGKPAPAITLPPLEGLMKDGRPVPGLDPASFTGEVTLVNVWASWCVPCRVEHPLLMQLASDERVRLVGINYKDSPENARRFLGDLGNPFSAVGADDNGRAAIEWGVYGVPETFLVGRDGKILYKHVGPFTPESIRDELMPVVERALAG